MQALNNKRTLYIVYQGFPVGHESDGNLIFNRIRACTCAGGGGHT